MTIWTRTQVRHHLENERDNVVVESAPGGGREDAVYAKGRMDAFEYVIDEYLGVIDECLGGEA